MLFQLRREKVELENALEQEQESLVNRLWKRMDKLETEKRLAFIESINNNSIQQRQSKNSMDEKNFKYHFHVFTHHLFLDIYLQKKEYHFFNHIISRLKWNWTFENTILILGCYEFFF